jgi:hypothetical protein
MSGPDPSANEFEIWLSNYKAVMRDVELERLSRTEGVNCDVSPNEEKASTP